MAGGAAALENKFQKEWTATRRAARARTVPFNVPTAPPATVENPEGEFDSDVQDAAREEALRLQYASLAQQQRRETIAQAKKAVQSNLVGDATKRALEKRTSQIIVRFLTEFLSVALSETIAYLLVPFIVMNTQFLVVNVLRRGETLNVPGFPSGIGLPPLALWEIAVILFIDFVIAWFVLALVSVLLAILVKIEEICSVPIISTICDII